MSRSVNFECAPGCRSQKHGSQIIAAIIRGTEAQAISYMKNVCHKGHVTNDIFGKSVLHVAASCGKRKVVQWLIANGVPLNEKDWESGYTPLHRALFYGQVHVAVTLIKAGANISALDYDALTPLDHINFDRLPVVSFTFSLPKHVYVWGNNANYNLGQTHQRARATPEWLECLHREGQTITDVILNKFHTLFLSTSGRVYACGLGYGGRLGIDSTAPVITPRSIKAFARNNIVKIAAGLEHSLFLTDNGHVYSCGNNCYHQLGINPPPESVYTPKQLSWHKSHRDQTAVGIGAAKYHSVIWTSRVLYTFGVNAGQLGHFKVENEPYIITPRSVTSIVLREEATLACVGVSDGATVVSTSLGDIYVLHQYRTRKIASKMLGIVKIACVGGHLDTKVGADGLIDKSDSALKIAVLVGGGVGCLYLWTEETAHLSRCLYTINRKINLIDFCLNIDSLSVVTEDGEAFNAIVLPPRERKSTDKVLAKTCWGPSKNFTEVIDRSSCIMLRLTRIAALHRTIAIMCDPKGRDFAALQNEPNSFLLDLPQISHSTMKEDLYTFMQLGNEYDSIHDVVIKCGNMVFPAHKYILANHSTYFKEAFINKENNNEDIDDIDGEKVWGSLQDSEKKCLSFTNIKPEIMQEILSYIYSGSCQLTTLGPCKFRQSPERDDYSDNINPNHWYTNDILNGHQDSDLVNEKEIQVKNSSKKKKGRKSGESEKKNKATSSKRPLELFKPAVKKPLQQLYAASRMLGIKSLIENLDKLEMVGGCIQLKYGYDFNDLKLIKSKKYCRESDKELWDVMIKSKSGDVLGAHKCILAARLEYFNCMFSASWMEAISSTSLSIPLPTGFLAFLLDYLYEDDSPKLRNSKDIEFVCNILTIADQFLITRWKEICEVTIVGLLTLRNAAEILEFAYSYNAEQLKCTTMQFISLNLAAMLENGSILTVSSNILKDLSTYYRQFIPRMSFRVITPYDQKPYAEDLEELLSNFPLNLPNSDEEWDDVSIGKESKNQTSSARKKKKSRRNSQGELRTRKVSTSSQRSISSSECDNINDLEDEMESLNFDDLEEREPVEPKKSLLKEESSVDLSTTKLVISNKDLNGEYDKSWQKVGRKKNSASGKGSVTPTEMCDESPIKEDIVISEALDIPKKVNEVTCSTPDTMQSKSSSLLTESPKSHFPTLGDSFTESKFPTLANSFTRSSRDLQPIKITSKTPITKLSQKQRRKQAAEATAAQSAEAVQTGAIKKTSISSSPWGTSSSSVGWGSEGKEREEVNKNSFSLADIIKAEELKAKKSSPPINIQRSRKISETNNGSFTPSKKGWSVESDSGGAGAWGSTVISPISSPCIPSQGAVGTLQNGFDAPCFSKIISEEELVRGHLLRERCKPLSLIQLEDRAIEELRSFYGADECCEEKITVTRVRAPIAALANPTWKKN